MQEDDLLKTNMSDRTNLFFSIAGFQPISFSENEPKKNLERPRHSARGLSKFSFASSAFCVYTIRMQEDDLLQTDISARTNLVFAIAVLQPISFSKNEPKKKIGETPALCQWSLQI